MTTPDFEDWLARQDVPVEETVTRERYRQYAIDEWGLHNGSLDVAEAMYDERYRGLEEYGIRPVERHYEYRGEPFVETRYVVSEEPGLWGKFRAYEFAAERAERAGAFDVAATMRERIRQMEKEPERRRIRWEER